ncbi:MAG: hypothetical protein DMG65_15100 [Candidatus Angelobacter sp. Gp1-AA117]|nr:MAG: hypothetical protein DMG65_15100 [Candidatus Angelobacter sp. Gp1-AA117]
MLSRFCLLVFFVHTVAAQVSISARTDKTEYLVGEPVIVLIEVKNIGDTPLVYGFGCDHDVQIKIPGLATESNDRYGCGRGVGGDSCGGIDHPPQLQPGSSRIFRRLLQNYRLGPGNFVVKVSGKSEVSRLSGKRDNIEGNTISASLPIFVRDGTDDELKKIYQPLVEAATCSLENLSYEELERASETRYMARKAIAEMAPPFLFNLLRSFALDKHNWSEGIRGLARMNTAESRNMLVELYEQSTDLVFQHSVAYALMSIAHPAQLDFFAGLLHGDKAAKDRNIQSIAIEALGRIGGWRAVAAFKAFHTDDAQLTNDLIYALGTTASQDAVPLLIKEYSAFNEGAPACEALTQLTHHDWCAVPPSRRSRVWSKWWGTHQEQLHIYNKDDCEWGNPVPLK